MVNSADQDFYDAARNMRKLNRDSVNALESISALQTDYFNFLSDAVSRAVSQNRGEDFSGGDPILMQVARLPFQETEIIFLRHALKIPMHGLGDIAIVRSLQDDKHIVLSGESIKKWLHYGVVSYNLNLDGSIEDEVDGLMTEYLRFSAPLASEFSTAHEVVPLLNPVEDLGAVYQRFLQKRWPDPLVFTNAAITASGPEPKAF